MNGKHTSLVCLLVLTAFHMMVCMELQQSANKNRLTFEDKKKILTNCKVVITEESLDPIPSGRSEDFQFDTLKNLGKYRGNSGSRLEEKGFVSCDPYSDVFAIGTSGSDMFTIYDELNDSIQEVSFHCPITSMAFGPYSFAFGVVDNYVVIRSRRLPFEEKFQFSVDKNLITEITQLAFNPANTDQLVVAGAKLLEQEKRYDGTVELWDLVKEERIKKFVCLGRIFNIMFNINIPGQLITVSEESDQVNYITIFDLEDDSQDGIFQVTDEGPGGFCFSASYPHVLSQIYCGIQQDEHGNLNLYRKQKHFDLNRLNKVIKKLKAELNEDQIHLLKVLANKPDVLTQQQKDALYTGGFLIENPKEPFEETGQSFFGKYCSML